MLNLGFLLEVLSSLENIHSFPVCTQCCRWQIPYETVMQKFRGVSRKTYFNMPF